MKVTPTEFPGVLILEPRVFGDERGFFFESYNRRAFREATGLDPDFVQDNHSKSARNVLRGLHYQVRNVQGKLVRARLARPAFAVEEYVGQPFPAARGDHEPRPPQREGARRREAEAARGAGDESGVSGEVMHPASLLLSAPRRA